MALATGVIQLGDNLVSRLPFDSPVLGGFALAAIVAVPSTILASHAWRGDPQTDRVAVITGVLLVGWIAVELAFLRELSWLHPTYVAIGVGFIVAGTRRERTRG